MAAGTHDIYMEQGTTLHEQFVYGTSSLPNPIAVETPYNLTGCTAKAQFREKYGMPVLLELSTETGEIVLGGALGTIEITATAEQTDTIEIKRGKWDLELTYPDTTKKRILMGTLYNSLAITREV
jgi:hypothetical protein